MAMKIRLGKLSVLCFAVASNVLMFTAASASPAYYDEITYYSDASRLTMVGEQTVTCNGGHYGWGQVTPYFTLDVHVWCGNTKGPEYNW
jgi:Family of unknown function (DUF6289)